MTNPYPPSGTNDPWSAPPATGSADPWSAHPTSPEASYPGTMPQPVMPQPMATPYPGYGYAPPLVPPTNNLAIASLVLALVGLGCQLTAPIGAIMGHVALKQIRERGESGEGMAKAGIIVGWILTGLMLVVIAIYVAIFAAALASGAASGTN
jgi:hypothetical protein